MPKNDERYQYSYKLIENYPQLKDHCTKKRRLIKTNNNNHIIFTIINQEEKYKYLELFYGMKEYNLTFSDLSKDITNSLSKDIKKQNGIFFTPPKTVKSDIDFILSIKKDIKNILEPSCGSCEFINYIDYKINSKNIDCVEFNETIYNNIKNIKFNNNFVNIVNDDFINYETTKKYDLIVGNPPYFNYPKKNVPKIYHQFLNGRTSIYIIFILKCLDLLSPGGILSFVLPQNFLNCSYYKLVRNKIFDEYTIINIINHSDEYLETEQKTCTVMIQNKIDKKLSENFIKYNKNNDLVFNTKDNIIKLKELEYNTNNLDSLGFTISVGNVVWNQEKEILSDNKDDILIIYSSDIKDNKYELYEFSDKCKREGKFHYIKKSGLKNNQLQSITNLPSLVVNRGYGNGNYTFNYALINETSDNNYLVENHVICIKPKIEKSKTELIELYKKIIKSFNDPRTKEFIKLSFTNDAINTNELQYSLPIFN
tara:strand:+ start:7818 stop:9263 length:1446 start_codon:yes stop_codon:yes gene_type:complete